MNKKKSEQPLRMTPEIAKMLVGIVPMKESSGYSFTPKSLEIPEIPVDIRPIFTIRLLKNEEAKKTRRFLVETALLADSSTPQERKDEILKTFDDDFGRKIVLECLVGWKNIYDLTTNEELPFSKDNIFFPETLLSELFQELVMASGIVPKNIPKAVKEASEVLTLKKETEELLGIKEDIEKDIENVE